MQCFGVGLSFTAWGFVTALMKGNGSLKWDASGANSTFCICGNVFAAFLHDVWAPPANLECESAVGRQCSRWVWISKYIWIYHLCMMCSEVLMQRWCGSSAWAGHLAARVSHRAFRRRHCPQAISSCTPREISGVYRAETSLEFNREMIGLRLLQAAVSRLEDLLELKEIIFIPSCALNLVSPKPKMQTLSLAPSPLHPSLKYLYTLMRFVLELLSWHSV